jgi:uncharacterized protein (DUF1015 family)
MAEIAPLTPLRYDLSRLVRGLEDVVAPPYDVISPDERTALAACDPHNVVRLILPQSEGGGDGDGGDGKYAAAGRLFSAWQAEGALVRDEQPAFYRYAQSFTPPGAGSAARVITRRGFLGLVRLAPFADRTVLPHERTLSGPKEDRLKLFRATRANLSPGFMLYSDPRGELNAAIDRSEPLADFTTSDGVRHQLSKVTDADALRAIVRGVARSSLLIADGHHRYETALRYSTEAADPDPRSEPRFFMTFLANGDDPSLVVFPTHRFVHSLPTASFDELERAAAEIFTVKPLDRGAPAAAIVEALAAAGKVGPSLAAAAPDGRVALLTLRPGADLARHPTLGSRPEVLRKTDVTLLHAGILEPILGITPEAQAAKTNLWYPQDTAAALGELRAGRGQLLFVMNATPVSDVRRVAEAGEVMPQKSTFFYPKVLTGLTIHTLDPARRVPAL